MTLHIIVAVRDSAMDAFAKPFFVPTVQIALRSFQQEVNRKHDENQMNLHPEDFELHQLGTYDESNGQLTNEGQRLICRAKDLINKE